ncbi:nucleotidyltransferase family protein [Alloiococcus sp. CFN-8]|uniref:nucleotidyltransferase family protein n=1 Tax=Alloiococcus sp. CFN-8 TaxID=3416081 RepID=UPI003CF451C2
MKKDFNGYKALILAAGLSTRMKSFKPLLPLGDKTIIEQTISRFLQAGLEKSDILVVIGRKAEELAPVLSKHGVSYVINDRYETSDMFYSIQLGLKELSEPLEGVLLSPGDIPLIKAGTITSLLEERKRSYFNIIIPSFNNRRGHPILLGKEIISAVASYNGKDGMHGFLKEQKNYIHYINVQDEYMLMDLDKPEDYERALKIYSEVKERGGELNEGN